MGIHWELLREAPLSNNCPECFNQDLSLRFKQKHINGRFSHRTTSEVQEELECNTCHNQIYPVTWTEDIEGSVAYYRKMVSPLRPSVRFTGLFYILLLLGMGLVAALIYLWLNGGFKF